MSPNDDTPIQRVFSALAAQGCNPRKTQSGYEAHCPAHDDRHKSLSVSEGRDGRVLINCHAGDGCEIDKITAELGLETRDLFAADTRRKSGGRGKITATYDYTNEAGTLLFQVVRFTAPKDFRQRRPDGNGGWIWKLGRTRRVLYRLPDVINTISKGEPVYIVEGEKDADAGARAGICTTTCPMGAGKWRKEYSETLRDARRVVIVADADDLGHKHAMQVGRSLRRHGKYCFFEIMKAKSGKDLFDHLEAGHTIDELELITRADATPADDAESPAPDSLDDQQEGESATQPPGNSDDEHSAASDGPDLPDLDLDPDQAKSVEELLGQIKKLDPGNQKKAHDVLGDLLNVIKETQATKLIKLALASGVELWHDPDGNGYATIPVDDHAEHWPIKSRAFRLWLRRRYYEEKETAAGANAVKDAIEVLDGRALFAGDEHAVHVRVAEHDGAIYVDLCDDGWRCIEITRNGWTVRNGAPVRFKRTPGMLPLPVPEADGDIADLRDFVNVTDDDWPLVLGWLLGTLRPRGPYVVLNVTGEHGSAKTTACRVLRRMIDPNTADDRAAPHDTRDLMIAATNGWICAFDNLSSLRQGLSDDLARLSTGTGFSVRKLYENDEEQLFSACRPIILTGIEDVVVRPDLLDRTIVIEPPRLEKKTAEKTFWTSFEDARPQLIGALLDAVAAALAGEDDVVIDNPPRMVDFARWVTAAEDALEIEDFVGKYRANWLRAQGLALEGDDAAIAIYKMAIKHREWTGTAGELAELVKPEKPPKSWPTTGVAIAGLLRRIMPVLRLHGVDVEYNHNARPRTWTLTCTTDPEKTDATDKQTETPSDQPKRDVSSAVTRDPTDCGTDGDADPVSQSSETDGLSDGDDTPSDQHRSQSVSSVSSLGDGLLDEPEHVLERELGAEPVEYIDADGNPIDDPLETTDQPDTEQLTIDGQPAPKRTKHPARFSDEIIPVLAAQLPPDEYPDVLDPFAGVGRIHELPNHTIGVEIEPEWATMHPGTIVADALALPFPDAAFDAICTSPTYGNRFADHHNAKDPSRRRSYTHDLGRKLHPNNSGKLQWGSEYRTFHARAWAQAVRVLCPGGRFVLNISDHDRDHQRQPVTVWHVETLTKLGLVEIARTDVETKRMRHGANADARPDAEHVITFEKPRSTP